MPYLVAAVVGLGVLGLFNLALTVGVVRRLRQYAAGAHRSEERTFAPMAPVGTVVADFAVPTVDGGSVSRDGLAAGTLVGFFTPGCEACEELLPAFVAYAGTFPGGAERVVAVVEAMADDAARYIATLSPVARVVADPPGRGVIVPAFGVRAFPGVVLVGAGGRITASGASIAALPVPVS